MCRAGEGLGLRLTLPRDASACAEWDLTVECWVSGQSPSQMLNWVQLRLELKSPSRFDTSV